MRPELKAPAPEMPFFLATLTPFSTLTGCDRRMMWQGLSLRDVHGPAVAVMVTSKFAREGRSAALPGRVGSHRQISEILLSMIRPRWKLSDLLLLVLACGVAFAAYRYFWWPPPDQNVRFHLSVYLVFLATATLGSFFARPGWRRPFQAFALFAWCNFVFVMWGGFVVSSLYDEQRVVEASNSGVVFGFLSALVAFWLFEPPGGGHRPA